MGENRYKQIGGKRGLIKKKERKKKKSMNDALFSSVSFLSLLPLSNAPSL